MIEVKNLVKDYGKHHAVKDISFSVPDGQIVGLLGPNGAGKSTTMNIMTGYISATSGEVKIGGYDILEQPLQAKKLIGYLPETPPLYEDMTVEEYRKAAVDAVQKLSIDVGIPTKLEALKEEDLDFLAESAHADACAPGNPKDASVEDLKNLFRKLM